MTQNVGIQGDTRDDKEPAMQFDVNKASGITTITLRGRMGFSDHSVFRDIIRAFDQAPGGTIVFNMGDLDFIDSSGLGMLIVARNEALKNEQDFVIEHVKYGVKRIMDMAKFERFFNIRP